ncbi:MAG: enoyl-CoA hydratase/isomerase family protein [Solimonas sp.]
MNPPEPSSLPAFKTLLLSRQGRRLTITLNRPELLNACNYEMHEELAEVFQFAHTDAHSDVVVITGAGRAFSAGGDIAHIARSAANPELFDQEARCAKRVIAGILDLDKPLVCRLNGHAVGLGATLALFCDVIFAAETAKIGDPHVSIGLVAGDGGAAIWAQRIGLGRAKEFLLSGELLTAAKAAEIGLVNHCLPAAGLDAAVDAFCDKLLGGAIKAIRWTKVLTNLELKRIATAVMDAGVAYESLSVRSDFHQNAVKAMVEKAAAKK